MLAPSLVALSLLCTVPVPNQPISESEWVGKVAFVKHGGTLLDPSAEPGDRTLAGGLGVPANMIQFRIHAERPGHVQLRMRTGTTGWLRKDEIVLLPEAVGFFTTRLETKPNDMDALSRRASAWRAMGELDAALKDASDAIRLNPHPALFNNRAIIHVAKKDYDRAIADYAQALTLNAKYSLVYANRASMWQGKKEYDKAIEDATRALEIETQNPGAFRLRGISWHGKKEYDKALADLNQAVQLDPHSAQCRTDRARSWVAKKDHAKAHADFSEAVRLEPHHVEALRTFAMWLASSPDAKQRDGRRAIALAERALKLEPNSARAMESRAAGYAELGRFEEAVRWQQRAMQDPSLKTDTAASDRLERYRKQQAYRQE